MKAKIKLNDKVRVARQNFGSLYVGREGTVTSIGKGVIPIHVTFTGENHETDFAKNELEVIV